MKRTMWLVLATIILLATAALATVRPSLGRAPRGARLERIMKSPNWRDGQFHNLTHTRLNTSNKGMLRTLWHFLTRRKPQGRTPETPIDAVKIDLTSLDMARDQLVWFGHSSYLLVIGGTSFLVDPVLHPSFPSTLILKAFKGTDIYKPEDLPPVDYLIITHDHYDHLDRHTVQCIRERIGHVFCPLGVGEHLEYWGYNPNVITEMDWNETADFQAKDSSVHRITCLPSQHFSGRFLQRNNTLWAAFMIECGGRTVFVGGDGGYGSHFTDIGSRFPNIDLAVMENGQYDEKWRAIHTMPDQLPSAIHALGAKQVQPVHNSKYALANHPWDEPIKTIHEAAQADTTIHLLGATIGSATPF
ncbi:MAG: MBL fold metallo-hydrolase [Bacteroidaceae bacterium]|nr:MBL fold metallo-hydrolase [Bacteroidaceae bacterium]